MRTIIGGKIGFLERADRKIVAAFHIFADAFDARLDDMITRSAGDDVDDFQNWNTAANQLRESARETRHTDLVDERTEDRQLQLPAIPDCLPRFERRKVRMPKKTPATIADQDVPIAANELADVDQELRRRGKFGAEILEDFAEDRDDFNDQESRDGKGNADDDDRISHGRLDLLAQACAGFEKAGQTIQNLREQSAVFACFDHAHKQSIEHARMLRDRFMESFATLDPRGDVADDRTQTLVCRFGSHCS